MASGFDLQQDSCATPVDGNMGRSILLPLAAGSGRGKEIAPERESRSSPNLGIVPSNPSPVIAGPGPIVFAAGGAPPSGIAGRSTPTLGRNYAPWDIPQGPRRAHVVAAVQHADRHERLGYRRAEVDLFTRHIPTARKPYTIHVTGWDVGGTFEVHAAFKVFDDLVFGIKDQGPLAMLELFARVFAHRMTVGDRCAHLFRSCTLPRNPDHGRDLYRLEKSDWDAITVLFLETEESHLHVALAWTLNLTAYRAYLLAMAA